MRLYTFQPDVIVEQLMRGEVFRCDEKLATFLQPEPYNFGFREAYDWLVSRMEERIPKPTGVTYPVWAWYKVYGETKKPDRRTGMFRNYDKFDSILEIEIPDDEVLLTDFDDWHYVINDFPYQTDEEYENNPDWEPTIEEKQESWEVVFNTENKKFVQACVWEIKPENIVRQHILRRNK